MAPAPYTTSKPVPKKVVNPLIEKRPRNFGIGKSKKYIINLLFLLKAFAASQNYLMNYTCFFFCHQNAHWSCSSTEIIDGSIDLYNKSCIHVSCGLKIEVNCSLKLWQLYIQEKYSFFSFDIKVGIFSQNVTWADLSDGQNTSGCKGKGVSFTSV